MDIWHEISHSQFPPKGVSIAQVCMGMFIMMQIKLQEEQMTTCRSYVFTIIFKHQMAEDI